jgi:trehalose/maltose transport system permease protein
MEPGLSAEGVAPVTAPLVSEKRRFASWSAPKTAVGRQQERLGWLLVLPSLLVVFAVAIYPLFETIRLSFTNTRLASTRTPRNVGFENYTDLWADDQWIRALKNTLIFTVGSVTLEAVLGMIVALTIHSQFKGRGLVRTSMLVPWAIPTVVSSLLWNWMLNDRYGVVNSVFKQLNLMDDSSNFAWVQKPSTALGAVIAVDVWKTTPFMALLLLAGLQIIPGDVYEAAYVDGATKWQQFWQMTLPLVKPALLVALIFRTMDSFRVFDLIYVLKGGASETMTVAIYTFQELFQANRLGAGSAAAVSIFLCIGLMVVGYSRLISVDEG